MYCWPRAAATALLRRAGSLLERGGEQAVGAVAALVGCEVVDFFEINAVDSRERHELEDVDRAGCFFVEGALALLSRARHIALWRTRIL